jgi:hypothetical protein
LRVDDKPEHKKSRSRKITLDDKEKARFIMKFGLMRPLDILEMVCQLVQQPILDHQRDLMEDYVDAVTGLGLNGNIVTLRNTPSDFLLVLHIYSNRITKLEFANECI